MVQTKVGAMTDSSEPTGVRGLQSESLHVQLTRMEGVLNLVLERTVNLADRMGKVEVRTGDLEAVTQRLDLDADARDKTAVALALALKDAEAERRTKTETTWSPFAKTITGILAVAGTASLVIQWLAMRP